MTHHYDTYREELAKAYPGFGYALWEADPGEHNPSIGVGDVGFTHAGRFYRLFNALLPADHSSNEIYGVPTDHEPLQPSRPDHINRGALAPNTFHSHGVTVVSGGIGVLASSTIGSAEVSFSCTREYGAILTLPVAARREDTVVLGLFRRWVIKNIDSWFAFAQELDLEIAMEDIILVTGCHRTRSWTNIAFNEAQADARLSLKVDVADASGANITWGSNDQIQGAEHNQGPSGKNLPENQCIFIRGYRVKRCLSPGRRDHQPAKEGMSISRATEYRDPLHVLLEYIAKRTPDCDLAIVHDDDLERILGVGDRNLLETLQPDVMTDYLQRSKLEIGVMSDSLLGNDQFPRTGTEPKAVAMLSEQLKISDLPSSVSSLSRLPIDTTNRDESARYDSPSSSSAIAGLEAHSLTPLSEHPLRSQRNKPLPSPLPVGPTPPPPPLQPRLPAPSRALPPSPHQLQRLIIPPPPPPPPSPPSLSPPTHTPLSATTVSPSLSLSPPHTASVTPVSPSKSPVSKRRLKLNPLSALRSSGANRRAAGQIAEHAAWQAGEYARYETEISSQPEFASEAARREAEEAARIEEEKAMRLARTQEEAKGNIRSHLQSFISSETLSEEDFSTVFFTCEEACQTVGLDLARVLQEPLIEGHPPIYWVILNRPYGTSRAAHDSLVFTLLERCQPLKSSTLTAIRLACRMASNNALLQRLFRHIPELSPLSTTDAMLLAPLNESDVVDVVETRDGTGSFVVHIKIPRFRLRMRVSKCVVIEFVASERTWYLKFAVVETSTDGRTGSKWFLSLELGEHSPVVCVDGDLFIEGSTLDPMDSCDFNGPLLAISFGSTTSELRPGRENAIKVRLDDGPMGPHLLNESSALVDAKGTLYAELNARLVRPALPAVVSDTSRKASPPRSPEKLISEVSYPSSGKSKAKKPPKVPTEKVYTSLRRGGR